MINILVFIFMIGGALASYFFNITLMLTIYLPIIGISRGIYILGYYIKIVERSQEISKQEKLYFIGKNAVVILLGLVHLYVALFFAIYSLMVAGKYFRNMGIWESNKKKKVFGNFLYRFSAIGFMTAYIIIMDYFALIPILLGVLIFFIHGLKYANYSLDELLERYRRRLIRKITPMIQYGIIFVLVILPLILLIGLQLFGLMFIDTSYKYILNNFNIISVVSINLPIIIAARLLFFLSINYYLNQEKEKVKISKIYSDRRLNLIIFQNILIIFLAIFIIHFAIFFAVYSLLISAIRYRNISIQSNNGRLKKLEIFSYILIPVSIFLALIFYFDVVSIILILIAAGLAGVFFLFRGKKFSIYSVQDIIKDIKRTVPKAFKYFLIAYLIIVPLFLLIGILTYGNPHKETYMVKMTDGTKLATDVYYSPLAWDHMTDKPLPAPVMLIRTPYGKDPMGVAYPPLYCSQGYHVVIQDFRGCYDSEGSTDFLLFTMDYSDGVDTIDWILDKDWSNGKIASSGISALCITQYLYAGMNPKGLKAQALWFGTPDLVQDAILEGAFHYGLIHNWIKGVAPDNWRKQIDVIYDHATNLSKLNDITGRSVTLDKYPNVYENVTVHGLHVGGFYDHFLKGTIRGYMGYDDRGAKEARGHQKMIIGPWCHGMVFMPQQGELTYPANSIGLPLIMEWETEILDEVIFRVEKDIWSGDRVAYYLMGDVDDPNCEANYWKYAKDWPLDYKENKWYMGFDKNGNSILVDNAADLYGEDGSGFQNETYDYDPRNPVETRGGNNEPFYTEYGAGPYDQRPVEEEDGKLRDDILVFKSEVLDKPYTIEGALKANLHIMSNCNDTDFMVKLCDIYPDGRRMLIIDSALTTRFRINTSSMNFIEPNTEYNITVDLAATAYQFNTGHRIAVTITSSNWDRFAINPNTGGPMTDHYAEGKIATNTIITGPGKSCIIFPELKA